MSFDSEFEDALSEDDVNRSSSSSNTSNNSANANNSDSARRLSVDQSPRAVIQRALSKENLKSVAFGLLPPLTWLPQVSGEFVNFDSFNLRLKRIQNYFQYVVFKVEVTQRHTGWLSCLCDAYSTSDRLCGTCWNVSRIRYCGFSNSFSFRCA